MDLHDLIDDVIEHPTPLRIEDHLAAGRAAVRRRRAPAVLGLGVAATAVVLLGTAAPWSPSGTAREATSPAASASGPSPSAGPVASSPVDPVVEYRPDGTLAVGDDWRVTERIDGPVDVPVQINGDLWAVPDRSVALELSDGTTTQWALAWASNRDGGSSRTRSEPADSGPSSLSAWAEIQVALESRSATPTVVQVGADGAMVGLNGVQVLGQRATPELDGAGRTTAVADVTFPGAPPSDGWVLLVRDGDTVSTYPIWGYPSVDSVDNDGPDTIDGFVAWAAPRVAAGAFR
ncbi:hypothetical protein [Nocardioides sp. 1609]|uniref:hypothetical protein n=1 Tax=Nocardioides sp. 1609 TaxID=2508327 RepID=UPI0010701740|nr:hypothetical protein [Nocardioides sp. 1609]